MTNQLLNITTESNSDGNKTIGVMSAQQSTITFAAAPVSITLVSKVLAAANQSWLWASSNLFLISFSLILGMLIYWFNAPVEGDKKKKLVGFLFALINSFAIAATVLGIETTMAINNIK